MQLYSVNSVINFGNTAEKIKDSMAGLLDNMSLAYRYNLYDEEKKVIDRRKAIEKITKIVISGFPATLYVQAKNTFIKIVIDRSPGKNDLVTIIPEEPLATKKEIDSNERVLDLELYVQLMLELTENFAIYELYTQELT